MVAGLPKLTLRIEGAAVFTAALFLYGRFGRAWWLLALLFFAPDLSMAGYLAGPRIGAYVYNAVHVYLGPAALAVIGITTKQSFVYALGLIWLGHIGFDRMLGYGLKYTSSFADTHLGRLGRDR